MLNLGENVLLEAFRDEPTSTFSYLLLDRTTGRCALIDSVLDYDPKSGRTATRGADRLLARVKALGAEVEWIIETHVHADHLSAAHYLRTQAGGRIAIGSRIGQVQRVFGELFNLDEAARQQGQPFDRLLEDGDTFSIGSLPARAMHTPGHTPACMTYVVEAAGRTLAFVGDTLFMPDYGTARCDFPGGDARTLFRSIRRVLALPDDTLLLMCHDYCPNGRAAQYLTTVAEQRARNLHVHDGVDEEQFVQMREARDRTLEMPLLILPSVQVNIRGGQLPAPEANGIRYLKIPLDVF